MAGLADSLKQRIAEGGPIGVGDYMTAALTDPEHGYYMSGDPFGVAGDFITAPEISQMFGELVGLWCAHQWQAMGRPNPTRLVELGPGRGTLMADALRAARGVAGFLAATSLTLIETSPALKARQRDALAPDGPAGTLAALDWAETFDAVPQGPVLAIANEFFDALPVDQFVMTADGWRERLVDVEGDGFRFAVADAPPGPGRAPRIEDAEEGAVAETRPAAAAVVRDIARRIRRHSGAALVIDYGHAESAAGDTFQAVRGHDYADPLADPGLADLTAHVDFEALAQAAADSGVSVFGPVDQGEFLVRLGIDARADALAQTRPEHAEAVHAARERLVAGDQMGRLFKVLALSHPDLPTPPGFA